MTADQDRYRDLVDRLDGLEAAQTGQRTWLDTAGTRLDELTEHLAELTEKITDAARQHAAAKPVNWLTMTDPESAATILAAVIAWHDTFLPLLGARLRFACWPWHPLAVVETLAISELHIHTYKGGPSSVADYLQRFLPGYRDRTRKDPVRNDLCAGPAHEQGNIRYSYDPACLEHYAHWWATSRTGLPPGLTPLVED